ncbi:MAG: hypothetical protein HW411_1445 [Gammaproteobacteria bacterium]|nr:hypothetical protein [Gammaproteobacteria bacterium]MBM2830655.1 hypothetical protein [Gammaproteobacteria bacterium]
MTNNSLLSDCRKSICLLLLQIPVHTLAGIDGLSPQQLVQQMSRATHELNYDGIFIYRHGRQLNTMRLIHQNGSDGEVERLVSLTGHPREIIRNNKSVTCIFPDNKSVMVEKSHPYTLPLTQLHESVEKLTAYYRFSISGQDRVAGIEATIVTIQPNDNYRYGYQLWIDNTNHLLLKSELKNESGYPLEQIEFTKLDVLQSISDEMLTPAIASDGYTRFDNTGQNTVTQNSNGYWQVKWMPDGFAMSKREKVPYSANSTEVDHMVYTDGMAMVSVFIEPVDLRLQFVPGLSRIGAVNAFARQANGFQVTVVGEVPPATVEKMAVSITNTN